MIEGSKQIICRPFDKDVNGWWWFSLCWSNDLSLTEDWKWWQRDVKSWHHQTRRTSHGDKRICWLLDFNEDLLVILSLSFSLHFNNIQKWWGDLWLLHLYWIHSTTGYLKLFREGWGLGTMRSASSGVISFILMIVLLFLQWIEREEDESSLGVQVSTTTNSFCIIECCHRPTLSSASASLFWCRRRRRGEERRVRSTQYFNDRCPMKPRVP